ncbi:hypothetical protein AG1IA_07236 [Rhizoctonia solani AG-1 IA]|uniref:Cytochrome P450 domain-containing protein n=1 Tax=Thanatephorus cucumeris (strain AG1-IA) TaxID=983506 RepID=L8WQW9_THACA|nr:hypothetical protein AG1IA_07236 [Rhizoctonia solani AG-1 IA]
MVTQGPKLQNHVPQCSQPLWGGMGSCPYNGMYQRQHSGGLMMSHYIVIPAKRTRQNQDSSPARKYPTHTHVIAGRLEPPTIPILYVHYIRALSFVLATFASKTFFGSDENTNDQCWRTEEWGKERRDAESGCHQGRTTELAGVNTRNGHVCSSGAHGEDLRRTQGEANLQQTNRARTTLYGMKGQGAHWQVPHRGTMIDMTTQHNCSERNMVLAIFLEPLKIYMHFGQPLLVLLWRDLCTSADHYSGSESIDSFELDQKFETVFVSIALYHEQLCGELNVVAVVGLRCRNNPTHKLSPLVHNQLIPGRLCGMGFLGSNHLAYTCDARKRQVGRCNLALPLVISESAKPIDYLWAWWTGLSKMTSFLSRSHRASEFFRVWSSTLPDRHVRPDGPEAAVRLLPHHFLSLGIYFQSPLVMNILHLRNSENNSSVHIRFPNAEATSDVLDKRSAVYSDRPNIPMVMDPALMDWSENVAAARYGDLWRSYRRILNHWLNAREVTRFYSQQEQQARLLLTIGSLMLQLAYGYKPRDPQDRFYTEVKLATRNIVEAAMQTNFLVNVFPVLSYIPDWFPGTGWKCIAREWKMQQERAKNEPYEWLKAHVVSCRLRIGALWGRLFLNN